MLDPIGELEIQRQRHEDWLREAEMARLARTASVGRASAWTRLTVATGDRMILLGCALKRRRLANACCCA